MPCQIPTRITEGIAHVVDESQAVLVDPEEREQRVQQPVAGVVDPQPDQRDRDGRRHLWQEDRGTEDAAGPQSGVQRQGHQQSQRHSERHGEEGVDDRVDDGFSEDRVVQHVPEVVQADELWRRQHVVPREGQDHRGDDRQADPERGVQQRGRHHQHSGPASTAPRTRRDPAGTLRHRLLLRRGRRPCGPGLHHGCRSHGDGSSHPADGGLGELGRVPRWRPSRTDRPRSRAPASA